MNGHSFGHCSSCYWCGLDGDDPEIEKPCDERENKKPSEEAMAAYYHKKDIAEKISDIAVFEWGTSLEWDEMMAKIDALRPDATGTITRLSLQNERLKAHVKLMEAAVTRRKKTSRYLYKKKCKQVVDLATILTKSKDYMADLERDLWHGDPIT